VKPILFNAPMVRALLDGRKTQTRRLMQPQPEPDTRGMLAGTSPYGGMGDQLWVKEGRTKGIAQARLRLTVTAVRCERLQALTEADARAEGVTNRDAFAHFWNGIFKDDGKRWGDSPWVWVITFTVERTAIV
jgi:hypothetical protein